jgi:hypothetical protein
MLVIFLAIVWKNSYIPYFLAAHNPGYALVSHQFQQSVNW